MLFLVVLVFGSVLLVDHVEYTQVILPGVSGLAAVFFAFLGLTLIMSRLAQLRMARLVGSERFSVQSLQSLYVRSQQAMRGLAVGAHFLLLFCTDWATSLRAVLGEHGAGLDEFVMLLPFVSLISVGYFTLYPLDRTIRESSTDDLLYLFEPVHPIWTRRQYMSFQLRFNLLLVAVPLIIILAAKDLLELIRPQLTAIGYHVLLRVNSTVSLHLDLRLAELSCELVLAVIAGLILLLSPLMVRTVWRCRSLPAGQLRDMLQALAGRVRLQCKDILLWPTYGIIANAAMVGLVGRIRYIMLSDGLIESLTDGQIEAVFGHEIGHVKHHHLPLLLTFAFAAMGLVSLAGWHAQFYLQLDSWTFEMMLFASVFLVWLGFFGRLSRMCERQADLFAAEALSAQFDDTAGGCGNDECLRHSLSRQPSPGEGEHICHAAAELVCSALGRASALNAVPKSARSWRHGSIGQRCQTVMHYAADPAEFARFRTKMLLVRCVIVAAAGITAIWGGLTVLT